MSVGKEAWGQGTACHCPHNPLSPSGRRVPGLTPATPFGLPVFPAGGSAACILPVSPTPTLAWPGPHAPASCRVLAVWMSSRQSWRALQVLPVPRVWAWRARRGGWEDVPALLVPGEPGVAAGSLGEVLPVV